MKYCKSCQEPMEESLEDGHFVYRCYGQDCWWQAFEFECANHKPEYRKKYKSNGYVMLITQCPTCFEDSSQLKQSLVPSVESLPLFNKTALDERRNIFYKKRADFNIEKAQRQKDQFFKRHNDYLKTEAWRAKRAKVLKRDGNLCQACLENPATQVHHLSYNNWQDEPLFELVSICEPCHKKIHNQQSKHTRQ